MCQMPTGPPDIPCRASEYGEDWGYKLCDCEDCITRAEMDNDISSGAVFIGEFDDQAKLVSFIEDVWCKKCDVDNDHLPLPTGESGNLWPRDLVELWLREDIIVTDGYGSYFWASDKHADFWGQHPSV